MTYRFVPNRWRLVAQLATLAITGILGVSIALTPPLVDPKLSEIESAMSNDIWAWFMVSISMVGFVSECINARSKNECRLTFVAVSFSHILLMSILIAYSASALVGLFRTGYWYNFGPPALGIYMALMHFIYVQRRKQLPLEIGR